MKRSIVMNEDMRRVYVALESVGDPCHVLSGHDLSILDLGLVNEVSRVGDVIEVNLTLTEATCVFAHRIVSDLEDLAADLPGVSSVTVVMQPLPIWEPSRMSARARRVFDARRAEFDATSRDAPVLIHSTTT
jgi:metal-sulfur cluster biosynthetic enzyme